MNRIDIFKGQLFTDKNVAIEGQLSFKQKLAIKGFVSYHMNDVKSKACKKFKAYTLFANAPRQSHFPIQEELTSYLDEQDIFNIYKFVENKAIPMKLWVDKVKSDIKDARVKLAVPSMFVNFCDLLTNGDSSPMSMFTGDYRLALYLCRELLEDQDFENLHSVCSVIINSIAEEVGYGEEVKDTIFIDTKDKSYKQNLMLLQGMDYSFDRIMPMSIVSAEEDINKGLDSDFMTDEELANVTLTKEDITELMKDYLEDSKDLPKNRVKDELEVFVTGLISDGYPVELVKDCLEEAQRTQSLSDIASTSICYTVKKVSKAIDKRVVSTTDFNTIVEAEQYIENIKQNFPDVAENFDFEIDTKTVN